MKRVTSTEFKVCDGTMLRGSFFPAQNESAPVVIMVPGLALLKEHIPESFVEQLRSRGFSCLIYDHRSFGASDGQPRNHADPAQQALDLHDAVTAAMELPGVDSSLVAVWGVGHGASAAVLCAAQDPRVSAVIVFAPRLSGSADARSFPENAAESIWREREAMALATQTPHAYVRVWANMDTPAPDDQGMTWLQSGEVPSIASDTGKHLGTVDTFWDGRMTMQSLFFIARCEAQWHLSQVRQPLLYLVVEDDPCTGSAESHKDVFLNANSQAEFKVLATQPGLSLDIFEQAIGVQIDFLRRVFLT